MQDSPRMRHRHCTVHNYLIIAIQNSLANCPRHILLRFISRYTLSGSWWERDTLKVPLEWLIVSWKLTPCLFAACSRNFLSSGKLYRPQYNLRTASWCCNKFTRIRRDNIFKILHATAVAGISFAKKVLQWNSSMPIKRSLCITWLQLTTGSDRWIFLECLDYIFLLPGARYDLCGQLV